ncbi:hypothetical protein EEB14_51030 [Rhodococcus sp. WS4]|nr:hypothetical protein EEB14_51030 [Rhodococcus sp. WS4]
MTTTGRPTVTGDADGFRAEGRSSASSSCRGTRTAVRSTAGSGGHDRAVTAATSSASGVTACGEKRCYQHELAPGAMGCSRRHWSDHERSHRL